MQLTVDSRFTCCALQIFRQAATPIDNCSKRVCEVKPRLHSNYDAAAHKRPEEEVVKSSIFLTVVLLTVTAFGQQTGTGKAQISLPKVKGVLQFDVGTANWEARFVGEETQLRALDRADHLLITAFLQKVKFPASAEECRAKWWPMTEKSTPMKRDQLRQYEKNGMAVVDYVVPEFRGKPIHDKDLHAYLGSRDLCAEVHLSKVQFVPEDENLFADVLATVQFLPDESGGEDRSRNTTNQYFAEGSQLYLKHDYAAAAKHYQKALDLEKQNRTLSKSLFRVLVDNLGMSYGLTGKLSEAKDTFEYGITQDADYPMFYYLLACTYGEMGKMDEGLDQLRQAYKYKANMIPGESLPDPLTDNSFRKFAKDQKFIGAVHGMQ
jgi:tetratricopeptide (TPR) repeat protein